MDMYSGHLDTHPWLVFQLDLRKLDPRCWMLLGEARSKCEHIARAPLMPQVRQRMQRVYLAKGAHATTAIEGNTLSEAEVLQHIEGKLDVPPSKAYLKKEVDNILVACNAIAHEDAVSELSVERICSFNLQVLKDLALEEGIVSGQIRTVSVGVSDYRAPHPRHCGPLLASFCDWMGEIRQSPLPACDLEWAILRSLLAHLYFVWIHPFGDGNGRTARLIELSLLLAAGVPQPAAHLLSNHYNETRTRYYSELRKASKTEEPGGFITYAIEGFVDQLRSQMQYVESQQVFLAWQSLVHEMVVPKHAPTRNRRRRLILALSAKEVPVQKSAIPDLSIDVARDYARKTEKTLTRDLNALAKLGLLAQTPEGYRARTELVLALRPNRG